MNYFRKITSACGQTTAEYAIVVGMITLGIVAALAGLNASVRAAISAAASAI